MFIFKKTKFSNNLSVMRVLLLVITSPAQLNKRSAEALDGIGVFSFMNISLSSGQDLILVVSSEVELRYCVSTSELLAAAFFLVKNALSSWSLSEPVCTSEQN
jgi:hypothetical protein